jgi:hypothetical protein
MQAVRGTRTEPADSAMPVAGESAHRCSFHPSKRFVMTTRFALTIVLTIVAGLWLDSIGPDWIQVLVSGWTWALLATLCWQVDPARRTLWLICLAWATFGEIVLSLVWGLYDYRLGNLPPFVPPGHVLLFALGMWLTERLPDTLTSVVPALAGGSKDRRAAGAAA